MLYGRSDIQEVSVPETGHRHGRKKGQTGPFELDCVECEALPQIGAVLGGVARRPEDAPLTEGEQREREAARDQALAGQYGQFQEFLAWQRLHGRSAPA